MATPSNAIVTAHSLMSASARDVQDGETEWRLAVERGGDIDRAFHAVIVARTAHSRYSERYERLVGRSP